MKTNVLGVQYDNVTMAEALDTARALLQRPEASYCVTPNAEMAYEALHDESFRAILNGASLVLPDGAGVVLGAKILKTPLKEKVAGIDFAANLLGVLEETGGRLYLLGGKPGIAQLVHQLQRGIGVQRAKDAGAGGGAVRKVPHKVAVARAGIVGIGIVGFLGVGVLLQPVQQLQIHGGAAVAVLRCVQVQIDQTGGNDFTRIVENFDPGRGGFGKTGAQAVFTQQVSVPHPQGIGSGGVQKSAFQGETIHRNDLSV